jgi:monolysocardiolipin acyltransferase
MDADTMPEIIPIWISRFDTMMPETRGWPRPVPRKGGNVSITIGEPLTSRIKPLVEEWKARHKTAMKIEDKEIHAGRDADEGERDLRIQICEALQDSLRTLGQEVEGAEGRFESGEWSNSKQKLTVGGKEDLVAATQRPGRQASM